MKYHHLYCRFTDGMMGERQPLGSSLVQDPPGSEALSDSRNKRGQLRDPLFSDIGQVGSLAGAAYLLNNNAGVLSGAQRRQKRHVAHQDKCFIDLVTFSTSPDRESAA